MSKKNPLPSKTVPDHFDIDIWYKEEVKDHFFENVLAYEIIQGKLIYIKTKDKVTYINLDLINKMNIFPIFPKKGFRK